MEAIAMNDIYKKKLRNNLSEFKTCVYRYSDIKIYIYTSK